MESHINVDHICWMPYQCFYCNQNGITTRKPTNSKLRNHVLEQHPNQQFTYLYTDNWRNNEILKDKMRRSTIDRHNLLPAEAVESPMLYTAHVKVEEISSASPFVAISQKTEVVDISESQRKSMNNEVITIDDDDDDDDDDIQIISKESYETPVEGMDKTPVIDQNPNSSENSRCGTCQQLVPSNPVMVRDHVKIHFKENTGCFPVDLSILPFNLQQIYFTLALKSFPVESTFILNNNISNNITANNEEERQDQNSIDVSENMMHGFNCGICKNNFAQEYLLREHEDSTDHFSTLAHLAKQKCNLCKIRYHSVKALHLHKQRQHIQRSKKFICKSCGQTFNKSGHLALHVRCKCSGHLSTDSDVSHGCKKCGKQFQKLTSLAFHQRRCKAAKVLSHSRHCNLCDKRFGSTRAFCGHKCKCTRNRRPTQRTEKQKTEKTSCSVACDLCHKLFDSQRAMRLHRQHKHGILGVENRCKKCKINVGTSNYSVAIHILKAHMNKNRLYECSLCKRVVAPSTIERHDSDHHKGMGRARSINNVHRYEKKIEKLRNNLIVKITDTTQKTEKTAGVSTTRSARRKIYGSKRAMLIHRGNKHGITRVQNYCQKCKKNVGSMSSIVATHIVTIHMRKNVYECSLCKMSVYPKIIKQHDFHFHNGNGNCRSVYSVHQYENEIKELRKKLIVKSFNSQLAIQHKESILSAVHQQSIIKQRSLRPNNGFIHSNKPTSLRDSDYIQKSERVEPKAATTKCQVCEKTFLGIRGMHRHKKSVHGITTQWYCKECNINVNEFSYHLLSAHLNKTQYHCSLCDRNGIVPRTFELHNQKHHGGARKANLISNRIHYKKQLKHMRDNLIVDAPYIHHSSEKKINIVQSITRQQLITKFQSKSVNRCDTSMWLSRYRQSRKRKQIQLKRRILKNSGHRNIVPESFPHVADATTALIVPSLMNAMSQAKLNG